MPSEENYRAKAEQCLQAASGATDPEAASLLRTLAAIYLALAEREASSQQQQQIQPKEPGPGDN